MFAFSLNDTADFQKSAAISLYTKDKSVGQSSSAWSVMLLFIVFLVKNALKYPTLSVQ
jgi:hypothetical protein